MTAIASEITALTEALVRAPSQGGIDSSAEVLEILETWLRRAGLEHRVVCDSDARPLGLLATVDSGRPGRHLCLDAPVDTAPTGRLEKWTHSPFAAFQTKGRLYGRGAADAKCGAAIFCVLARELTSANSLRKGRVDVLLEADEHTGNFGCVRRLVDESRWSPDLVAVGYPGNFQVMVGARGFYRVRVRTYGTETHSGSKKETIGQNAVVKLARVVNLLSETALDALPGDDFPIIPKLTITGVSGGQGFSQVPGHATAAVDIRLTPTFTKTAAEGLLSRILAKADQIWPTTQSSAAELVGSWPAYRLDDGEEFPALLREAASSQFSREVRFDGCGPSNMCNFLAARGIPAVCGFGATYRNLHAADEYIELSSLPPVFESYKSATLGWLNGC